MPEQSLPSIFVSACLINNFVLAYFLGICPFLGVSGKVATALNERFGPATARAGTALHDGDRLEVLAAMQGG